MLHAARFAFGPNEEAPVPLLPSKARKATTKLAVVIGITGSAVGATGLALAFRRKPEALLALRAHVLLAARETAWSTQSAGHILAEVQNEAACTGGAA